MEEEMEMQGSTGMRDSTEAAGGADSRTAESRRGPGWKGWVLSILVAVILSVTATLLLGGYGAGSNCCPTADAGK
jgi:hypothetical protein